MVRSGKVPSTFPVYVAFTLPLDKAICFHTVVVDELHVIFSAAFSPSGLGLE